MKRTGENTSTSSEKVVRKSLNKTTLAFMVLFVLGVIGIVFVVLYVNKATGLVLKEETYQYFGTTATHHSEGTSLTNSEMSTIMTENKINVGVEDTPLYALDGKSIYLPQSYSYYAVDENYLCRIPEFMKLTREGTSEIIQCTFNDDYYEIGHGFLFDGSTNYIFLDDGQIIINDNTVYPISKFSFFSMDYGIYRIYDLSSDEITKIERDTSNIMYKSFGGYSIDLYRGVYVDRDGRESLLVASPSLLPSIDER